MNGPVPISVVSIDSLSTSSREKMVAFCSASGTMKSGDGRPMCADSVKSSATSQLLTALNSPCHTPVVA